MQPTYRAAPVMLCRAPAKVFTAALEAIQFAQQAADAFRIGYQVYEVLAGRPRRLGTFRPAPIRR